MSCTTLLPESGSRSGSAWSLGVGSGVGPQAASSAAITTNTSIAIRPTRRLAISYLPASLHLRWISAGTAVGGADATSSSAFATPLPAAKLPAQQPVGLAEHVAGTGVGAVLVGGTLAVIFATLARLHLPVATYGCRWRFRPRWWLFASAACRGREAARCAGRGAEGPPLALVRAIDVGDLQVFTVGADDHVGPVPLEDVGRDFDAVVDRKVLAGTGGLIAVFTTFPLLRRNLVSGTCHSHCRYRSI